MMMGERAMHPAIDSRTAASLARPFRMLIDGQFVDALGGETIDVRNPATGEVIATVPVGGKEDMDRAVAAARRAFDQGSWSSLRPDERGRILWRTAELLEARADEFAELETLDNGKPIASARHGDIPYAASVLRYWAGWCTKVGGTTPLADTPGEYMVQTWPEPVGVAGLITPWNYPLAMAVVKHGPALAAGCTTIHKPAEQTPLTALRLGELFMEAGMPPGVVNIVTGHGRVAGAALADHEGVDKISFTGSTEVGKSLIGASRGNLKRLSLELGGKSPTIIFPDADMEKAIAGAAFGIFRNSGQVCAAGSRLYVPRSHFDQVIEGMAAIAQAHRIGPGLDPATTLGPVVSDVQQHRVLGYIESGIAEGATVVTGGRARGDQGYFVEPTILTDVNPRMRVVREEIFGPVVVATPVDDVEELAALANGTIYGLATTIWTQNISNAYRLAKRLRAGYVWVNCNGIAGPNLPFGGFKQSGWGREGGPEGIHAFTETKTVITAL
ncbi:aldehyde dehydrogenase family protein [Sphingobium sp. EM0848]|uniref:aldehyde dehydrogenase family protein n=1 Tax=Sphingobium sp. EM0848 TaxID=2743473 RepID=UPI0026F3EBB8|nr:aldehyde dehydrogenase family protein [Sphingobium sp. EM0848]